MSGVRAGTRLQQLEALRRRITHNLAIAQHHGTPTSDLHRLAAAVDDEIRAEGGTPPPPTLTRRKPPRERRRPPLAVDQLLTDLGVQTTTVRAWAVEQQLIPAGRRGRLPYAVVEAYAHHRKAGTP